MKDKLNHSNDFQNKSQTRKKKTYSGTKVRQKKEQYCSKLLTQVAAFLFHKCDSSLYDGDPLESNYNIRYKFHFANISNSVRYKFLF